MMIADVPVEWGAARVRVTPMPSWLVLAGPANGDALEQDPRAASPPQVAAPEPADAEPETRPRDGALDEGAAPFDAIVPPPADATGPDDVADTSDALRLALLEAIGVGARARRHALAASERDLVKLAIVIARQVVARELTMDPALVTAWVREGLAALGEQDEIVVAVAPDVAELLPPDVWASALEGVAPAIVDRSLRRSGCEVRGRYGLVDVGVEARLEAVIEALGAPQPGRADAEAP